MDDTVWVLSVLQPVHNFIIICESELSAIQQLYNHVRYIDGYKECKWAIEDDMQDVIDDFFDTHPNYAYTIVEHPVELEGTKYSSTVLAVMEGDYARPATE